MAFSLTREKIAKKALQKLGVLDAVEAPDAADQKHAIDALDMLLKELPWHGYHWPKIVSGQASLTFTAATQTVNLPADYVNNAMITYVDASGNEVPLELLTLDKWNAIIRKTDAAEYPTHGFIDNFDVLWLWPVQTANVAGLLVYQQAIDDTTNNTTPDMAVDASRTMIYGIASEIGPDFGTDPVLQNLIDGRWDTLKALLISNQRFPEFDSVTVDD